MRIGRVNRSTRRKPAPVPLCPPQISHHLFPLFLLRVPPYTWHITPPQCPTLNVWNPAVDLTIRLAISTLVVLLKAVSRFPVVSNCSFFRSRVLRYRGRLSPRSFIRLLTRSSCLRPRSLMYTRYKKIMGTTFLFVTKSRPVLRPTSSPSREYLWLIDNLKFLKDL
jgi:hypothetical protein